MKKVIYLTGKIFPLDSGDSLYSFGLCKELNRITDLRVFSYIGNKKFDYDKQYSEFRFLKFFNCINYSKLDKKWSHFVYIWPLDTMLLSSVEEMILSEKIDYIIIDHIRMYNYFKYLKKIYNNIKFIYVSHNVESVNIKQFCEFSYHSRNKIYTNGIAKLVKKTISKVRCSFHKKCEKILITKSDASLCISREDIRVFDKLFKNHSKCIFNKPLIRFKKVKKQEDMIIFNKKLLIVGSMIWYPNVNGVVWFINNVFSRIVEIDDEYQLYIVGSNPAIEIIENASRYPKNITVTGFVPNTEYYFDMCDISIIPIFEGTGAKIKVLESISRGIPTICSEFTAKDYDVNDEILVSATAEDFYQNIISVENNSNLRIELLKKMDKYYKKYMYLEEEVKKLF